MSSAIHPTFAASVVPTRTPISNSLAAVAVPSIPPGTFAPGTKVQVGGHRVIIVKYLSEGGFAHVYHVRLPKPIDGDDGAVLKRVAVPDKESLASMRTEVETMKKLKGHRHIVTYIDSHASQLKGGGYEVFLLMEYCGGGGLIDFMNTRLQNRLTEPEILKIFSDVAQGVACMHYLKPPLLHRDLKVENVLISSSGTSRQYKLCDFGSTAPPRPAATTAAEGRLIEDDVQKHTTLQYRSPEMIDVYRKQPIDEKSDIWALGVLLYKLCYYTTPFEEQGQMAILNASFKFPGYPTFTDTLKKLIASMLREKPQARPNIYQVVREVCLMRGTDVPIKDIYTGRAASEIRRNQQLPSPPGNIASPPPVGAYKASTVEEKLSIPEVTPMRRGRPTDSSAKQLISRPSASPMRVVNSDPFAALDTSPDAAPDAVLLDDVSARFPPLDQFSILHESGNKFAFDQKSALPATTQPKDISQRVTEALADDAFALPVISSTEPLTHSRSVPASMDTRSSSKSVVSKQLLPKPLRPQQMQQPIPQRSNMVSTGTMTSPSPPPHESTSSRPIFRFPPPSDQRASSHPRISDQSGTADIPAENGSLLPRRPNMLDSKSKSQTTTLSTMKPSVSSRPSLEGGRPAAINYDDTLSRSRSTNLRSRPVSAHLEPSRRMLHARSPSRGSPLTGGSDHQFPDQEWQVAEPAGISGEDLESGKIESNVEFLRAMEEEDPGKRKVKRSSSGSKHIKRASMPSISLSGTKSLLAGRFGDAFRRFETNTSGSNQRDRSPSVEGRGSDLTPIAGSEATDGRSDDGQVVEETEETPPETRRELERRRLSLEERRVAEAAAAYKHRLAESGNEGGRGRSDGTRAALIQNKVQALLVENGKSSPTKTAEGYGRFTDMQRRVDETGVTEPSLLHSRNLPIRSPAQGDLPSTLQRDLPTSKSSTTPNEQAPSRPSAPPKPQALRTGGRGEPPGVVSARGPPSGARLAQHFEVINNNDNEDWETDFSKRYPSLSGIEMVETEIDKKHPTGFSMKDV
ncbi:hypothetical protein MMC11_004379 [Xylographa trunciseda]|nr:hypothetical protein [Xylographa trunciseda]